MWGGVGWDGVGSYFLGHFWLLNHMKEGHHSLHGFRRGSGHSRRRGGGSGSCEEELVCLTPG